MTEEQKSTPARQGTPEEQQFIRASMALGIVTNQFRACLNTMVKFHEALTKMVPDPSLFGKVSEVVKSEYPPESQKNALEEIQSMEELYSKILAFKADPKTVKLLEEITQLDDEIVKRGMERMTAQDPSLN